MTLLHCRRGANSLSLSCFLVKENRAEPLAALREVLPLADDHELTADNLIRRQSVHRSGATGFAMDSRRRDLRSLRRFRRNRGFVAAAVWSWPSGSRLRVNRRSRGPDPPAGTERSGAGRRARRGSWDGGGAARLVEDRAARFAAQLMLDLPGVIDGHDERSAPAPPPRPATPPDAAPGAEWQGAAAAPGVAAGPACVLRDPHDGAGMARGDVLVAPSTDPGWTPLFLRASAVVMETGGYLSHGAVVAREFGLPAVVNVPDAMRRIAAGDRLRVDGDRGRVSRLDGSSRVE